MIYEYKCLSDGCKRKFRKDFPMNSNRNKVKCPHCGSKKIKKVIHKTEVIFKGPGFYKTDNKK